MPFHSICGNLTSAIEDFVQRGSGWISDKLLALDLHLLEFDSFSATSYIPLPAYIQNKKAVLNIRNREEKCFLWSVIVVYMEILMQEIFVLFHSQ